MIEICAFAMHSLHYFYFNLDYIIKWPLTLTNFLNICESPAPLAYKGWTLRTMWVYKIM